MLKIEAEHPVRSLDQLPVSLKTQKSTRFIVSASIEEECVEEIGLTTFIQSMLVAPSLELREAVLTDLVPEVIPAVEAVSAPQATAAHKRKGVYVTRDTINEAQGDIDWDSCRLRSKRWRMSPSPGK